MAERKTKLHANISPTEYHWVGTGSGLGGASYNYVIGQHTGTVELFIGRKDSTINKKILDELHSHKVEIRKSGRAVSS